MFNRNRFSGLILSLALIATFGVVGYAQQATDAGKSTEQAQTRGMKRSGRGHHGMQVLRIIRDLNLTDAQNEQARAIFDSFRTKIEPQRQAL